MFPSIVHPSYSIHFGDLQKTGFESVLRTQFADAKKVIITDETVAELWVHPFVVTFPSLKEAKIISVPSGERHKNLTTCQSVWEVLSAAEIGRSDLIVCVGGGVVTDMGGFIAALFKRGLSFIHIPTTLLAQVDASVGGKTGIDAGPHKNQLGVFAHAKHVFIDDQFLATLPVEQLISAYAEMIKHGLVADADYFADLLKTDPAATTQRMEQVYRSVHIKQRIVEADHQESGLRKVLNFGHTIGHAIEGYLLQQGRPTLHGYAVAWGMAAEAYIAREKQQLSSSSYAQVRAAIARHFPPCPLTEAEVDPLIQLMKNDKKNRRGRLQFSLLSSIGTGTYDEEVPLPFLIAACKQLLTR